MALPVPPGNPDPTKAKGLLQQALAVRAGPKGGPDARPQKPGHGPAPVDPRQAEEAPVREAEAVEGVDLAVRSPALLHEDLPFHHHHGGVVGAKP